MTSQSVQWDVPADAVSAIHAPVLQLVVTAGIAAVLAGLWLRFRKPHFLWWTLAWALYAVRNAVILLFLVTEETQWLFWHQVATGWTAVAFLWAALVFATGRLLPRAVGVLIWAFPLVWSYLAVYRLDHFLWAAAPAVAFLSGATLWTALVFWRHYRQLPSWSSMMLAIGFALWGLHHLDYPFLRAQGIWNPWGTYLDILFELWTAAGLLLLVQHDLQEGLGALARISTDVQAATGKGEAEQLLLDRPLELPGVVGAALLHRDQGIVAGSGACAAWRTEGPPSSLPSITARALTSGQYELATLPDHRVGILPLGPAPRTEALVLLSEARDPFTALDSTYLEAFGRQIGTALVQIRLRDQSAERGLLLQKLAGRLAREHEEERAALSRELHDETAQVLAALSLELQSLRESLAPEQAERAEAALGMVKGSIAGIRAVTDRLRPPLLDELGLSRALLGLADMYRRDAGIAVTLEAPDLPIETDAERELTLYRAVQETLANVARHAGAASADVSLSVQGQNAVLSVVDRGIGVAERETLWAGGGLSGLRERLTPLGGELEVESVAGKGTQVHVTLPLAGAGE